MSGHNAAQLTSVKQWIHVLLLAVLVVASAIGVAYSTHQTRKLVADFQLLKTQQYAMQVEWGQLLLEQSTWGSFNRVEQLASKRLGMRVPEPGQIIMVKL